jgi:hypothetical protein
MHAKGQQSQRERALDRNSRRKQGGKRGRGWGPDPHDERDAHAEHLPEAHALVRARARARAAHARRARSTTGERVGHDPGPRGRVRRAGAAGRARAVARALVAHKGEEVR